MEGTGSWGVGLARFLGDHDVMVVEVDRPNRQKRRREGKSDPTDARTPEARPVMPCCEVRRQRRAGTQRSRQHPPTRQSNRLCSGTLVYKPHRSRPANIDHSERQSLPSCLPGPLAFDPLTTVGVGVLGGGCCSNRESRLARYAGSAVLGWGSRPEISASSARLGLWLQDHNGGLSRP